MIQDFFRQNAYLRERSAQLTAAPEAGIVLDRAMFSSLGSGQTGDSGVQSFAP